MTVSYQWGPDDSAWKTLRDVFALPLNGMAERARSATAYAGTNPLKWLLVGLGSVGVFLGVLVYWLFALFPLGSYLFLWVLAMPCVIAVYLVRGVTALVRRDGARADRRDLADDAPGAPVASGAATSTPGSTASAAAPRPRRSTPPPRTSPG